MFMRGRSLFGIVLCALILTSLAGVMAQTGGLPPATPPSQTPPAGEAEKPRQEVAEPKIVRWVCTDHVCGGCDGACSRNGHVAVSRGGHCACTPRAGDKLDQAIRKAFQSHLKGR